MTQFQQLAVVPRITEHFTVPVLVALVGALPFRILGFHADNGSEYVNHRVAAMLNKLHIEEFTTPGGRYARHARLAYAVRFPYPSGRK